MCKCETGKVTNGQAHASWCAGWYQQQQDKRDQTENAYKVTIAKGDTVIVVIQVKAPSFSEARIQAAYYLGENEYVYSIFRQDEHTGTHRAVFTP